MGFFYSISHTLLVGMFAALLMLLSQTLHQVNSSTSSPGLGFQPSIPTLDSNLIWYKSSERENMKKWTEKLDDFLQVYRVPGLTPGRGQNIYFCDYNRHPEPGQVCDENVKDWYPCTSENNYAFHRAAPCIFLKLESIYGWVPEFYNDTNSLPANMPTELKRFINETAANNTKALNTIWVSCDGKNPADKENVGRIKYIPNRRGFPGFFFPFKNEEGYLSPLVAIQFERPQRGLVIDIECKAWAKNIIHERNRVGSVNFELLID